MKVLVVDDEQNIRETLKEFLSKEGYEVSIAENGQDALDKFNTEKHDIIFMDVKMPGIDGVQAFRQIKKINPQTKVIIISGLADDITFDRAVTISPESVEAFLPKPFRPDDIRKCLEKIISGDKPDAIFQLTEKQTNALNKLVLVCTENASTAFTQILQKDTKISLHKVNVLPIQKEGITGKEPISVLMYVNALGQITGKILINFSWETGLNLADVLLKRELGITKTFDEKSKNMLSIAANILAGSYLNAITQLLGLSTQPTMPEIMFEKKNNALNSLVKEFKQITSDTEYFFTIQTILSIVGISVPQFEIIFIPSIDSLKIILHKLGTLE